MIKNRIGLKGVLLTLAALLAMAAPSLAQIRQPVKWSVESKKVKKNVYDIIATGSIRTGWHIYDLQDYELGPNPTLFSVSGEAIEADGAPQITSAVDRNYDEIFEMEIGTCEGPVTIVQRPQRSCAARYSPSMNSMPGRKTGPKPR